MSALIDMDFFLFCVLCVYYVYDFIINIVSAYSGGIGGRALMALSWLLSWLSVSFLLHVKYTVSRDGAPIGAGGHDPPPLFEAKGDGGT